LEFVVRCAYWKYRDEKGVSTVEKVERVLDVLFKEEGVDWKRRRPHFEIEVSSESDYDTDN